MKILPAVLLLALPASALSEWVLLPETTMAELYEVPESRFWVDSGVSGTSAVSWPNGDQAIVTYIEIFNGADKQLHRCIEYFSEDMTPTRTNCYLLAPEE